MKFLIYRDPDKLEKSVGIEFMWLNDVGKNLEMISVGPNIKRALKFESKSEALVMIASLQHIFSRSNFNWNYYVNHDE